MIRAGQLRDLVMLQQPVEKTARDGERVTVWEDVGQVWAKVWAVGGHEYLTSREQHADATIKVTIRYYHGLDNTWRIKIDDRILDFVHVVDFQGKRRVQQILCREMIG